jgi:hypothetical protein
MNHSSAPLCVISNLIPRKFSIPDFSRLLSMIMKEKGTKRRFKALGILLRTSYAGQAGRWALGN